MTEVARAHNDAVLAASEVEDWEHEVEARLPVSSGGATDAELQMDYLLEKMQEEAEALRMLDEFTARRIAMIRAHADEEGAKHQRRMAWLEQRIRLCVGFDPAHFESTYRKKSIKLPHGTVGYRSSKESVDIRDAARALAFAKERGIQTKVTESVNKTPILEWIRENGEVPDLEECGFELVPATDKFFVMVAK